MGKEVDLLRYYPRGGAGRGERAPVSDADRRLAKEFGFDYFDGSRQHGYGGYRYQPHYWQRTVELLIEYYGLTEGAKILDIGCAKGFTIHDLALSLPGVCCVGLDISTYALDHRKVEANLSYVQGDACSLPFRDSTFDFVLSINTLHNLPLDLCVKGLNEIERVGRGASYIVVDGWRTPEEEVDLRAWVLTAETMMSVTEWEMVFRDSGYSGDYSFWSLPSK